MTAKKTARKKAAKKTAPKRAAPKKTATPPEDKPLTPKERIFVGEYQVHMNAAKAARNAGYSENTARAIGYELLTKPHVRKAIDTAIEERQARLKIDADSLLMQLVEQNIADIQDLFDEGDVLKPIDEWPLAFRQGLVAGIEVENIYEGTGEKRQIIGQVKKIKLADRHKVREMIGRHVNVQAFKDQKQLEASDPLMELLAQIGGKSVRPKA